MNTYECKTCNIKYNNKRGYNIHIDSKRHKKIMNQNDQTKLEWYDTNNNKTYVRCTICMKTMIKNNFKRHVEKCKIKDQKNKDKLLTEDQIKIIELEKRVKLLTFNIFFIKHSHIKRLI